MKTSRKIGNVKVTLEKQGTTKGIFSVTAKTGKVKNNSVIKKQTQSQNIEKVRNVSKKLYNDPPQPQGNFNPLKNMQDNKRRNQKELQKLAVLMGVGDLFNSGDEQTIKKVKKRQIANSGGGLTVGNGIVRDDGSAVFFAK